MPTIPKHKTMSWEREPTKKPTNVVFNYHTNKWRKTATNYKQENPLCVHCLKEGRATPAKVVDHIKPIKKRINDPNYDPYDIKELQGLCTKHDSIKRRKERDLY